MEVKTKKIIAREVLFLVKMVVPTAVGIGFGILFVFIGAVDLGVFIAVASLAIYPIALLVRLFNWAKETVSADE